MPVKKLKRGRYAASFELISDEPKQTKENEITAIYSQKLEQEIQENPAYWLWSHDRWKISYERWLAEKNKVTVE